MFFRQPFCLNKLNKNYNYNKVFEFKFTKLFSKI